MVGDVGHDALVEAFEQGDAALEALAEVNLAAHGALGDGLDLIADAGVTADIPETATDLAGNALIKARFLHNLTGQACFADDTGLEVDALGGEPGVRTARYAGPECDPDRNIDKLLAALEGETFRRARFRTAIAFIDEDGSETMFEGE